MYGQEKCLTFILGKFNQNAVCYMTFVMNLHYLFRTLFCGESFHLKTSKFLILNLNFQIKAD